MKWPILEREMADIKTRYNSGRFLIVIISPNRHIKNYPQVYLIYIIFLSFIPLSHRLSVILHTLKC